MKERKQGEGKADTFLGAFSTQCKAFKDGDVRFLICTDVAARGIDIKELPFCINMTLPDSTQIEDYIHRSAPKAQFLLSPSLYSLYDLT